MAADEMVKVAPEYLFELRCKAAQHDDNRLGKRTMSDLSAAYRVGWVAGFGLALAARVEAVGEGTPYSDVHTAWTNYVPSWVDVAELGEHWKRGFDHGMQNAREHTYL
jgi:hypothetical protein